MSSYTPPELHGDPSRGWSFEVRVLPRARLDAVGGQRGGTLIVRTRAPAEDGRANQAVLELLADALSVPRSALALTQGERSRNKRFLVQNLSREQLSKRLQQLCRTP